MTAPDAGCETQTRERRRDSHWDLDRLAAGRPWQPRGSGEVQLPGRGRRALQDDGSTRAQAAVLGRAGLIHSLIVTSEVRQLLAFEGRAPGPPIRDSPSFFADRSAWLVDVSMNSAVELQPDFQTIRSWRSSTATLPEPPSTKLASRFGIHRATVSTHLHRQGITVRRQGLDTEGIAHAVRLYQEGWSVARVGERLGDDAAPSGKRSEPRASPCATSTAANSDSSPIPSAS